ncbi:MAG TPA: ABC transporter permease [Actinomycetes bacterium]|nr:ABC transporter permease [Actinomycetes bacterium]
MTQLDVSPLPGVARTSSRVLAHTRLELAMMLRNGEQLLLTLVLPLGLLIGLSLTTVVDVGTGPARTDRLAVIVPGILALAVLSTAFTGLAIQTGFERRYGVLKRLSATPLSRNDLLAGKSCAVLAVELGQVILLAGTGLALGWQPSVTGLVLCLPILVLGTAAFASLGLLLAGTLRAEATLAGANVVYLLLLAAGGIVIPLSELPSAARPWVELLPSAALAEALRTATEHGSVAVIDCLVLLVWLAAGSAATARWFHWE